jgi:hypothetical protein
MSEGAVDLSQIRGDWKFHMDYLQNAIDQTMQRQVQRWGDLGDDEEIDNAVAEQSRIWGELIANANDKGTIPTADGRIEAFITACRGAKARCDAYEDKVDSVTVEEFSEAGRQVRALCDDLEMMKDQRPENL